MAETAPGSCVAGWNGPAESDRQVRFAAEHDSDPHEVVTFAEASRPLSVIVADTLFSIKDW